jgi:hypothetical protein
MEELKKRESSFQSVEYLDAPADQISRLKQIPFGIELAYKKPNRGIYETTYHTFFNVHPFGICSGEA